MRRYFALFLGLCLVVASSGPVMADVVISEFLANNNNGITDEDGERGDWIELYNNGTSIENLLGWRLTDNAGAPAKWTLPAVALEPKGFLTVFASAKDRTDVNGVLHTNFKLSASGGYLALIRANGTVATEFNPYPAQYDDRPYGFGQSVTTTSLIGPSAALRYFVPTSATPDNATWTAHTFSDLGWSTGANGIGFVATVPGWAFKTFYSNASVGSIAQAESVITNVALQSSVQQGTHPVINFDNSASPGHYSVENPPTWLATGDADWFVVEGTGTITVPVAGVWSFCVSSDDGCSLQIRPVGGSYTTVLSYPAPRGMGDTIGTYNFAAAGQYEIRVVVYENTGGAGGEVSARQGGVAAWDGTFKLIGDTANGGLAIQSLPFVAGGADFGPYIGANLKAPMFDATPKKSSAYVRYSFNNPGGLTSLSLPIRYDDGIAVYLNGTQVATRNAPGSLTDTSVATADRPASRARQQEVIDLTPHLGLLVAGAGNVLAIHGLNQAANNGDFLVKGELYQYAVTHTSTANFYSSATPGTFNTTAIYNKVAPVVASKERGFYSTVQSVTLTTGTAGATIRYTFDGSTPVEANGASATYTGPISINKTTTLRYRAFKPGSDASDTVTQTYIFTADVIIQSPTGTPPVITNPTGATVATTTWPGTSIGNGKYQINSQEMDFGMDPDIVNNAAYSGTIQNDLKAIPTFSIVTDLGNLFDTANGIYSNPGGDGMPWERPASVELINPDGTVGFQVNCGLRLRGGYSRSTGNPKHAFRFFFRDSYGPSKLNYPLFGDDPTGADEFDRFDIRCAQNYSWSFEGNGNGHFLQDPFARDQQLAMGHPSSHGGFYHLYVNGHYWGLYNIDERPDANFGATYLGGDPADFDALKVDPDINYNLEATDGNFGAWTTLWQLADTGMAAANPEATNNANYLRMLGRNPNGSPNAAYPVLLDAVNTIDSMLVVYWGGNRDAQISAFLSNQSPNNTYFLRDRTGASGGFRSILHDSEHSLLDVNENRLGPWPAGSSTVAGGGGFGKSTPQYILQQCMYSSEFRAAFTDRVYKHCFNGGVLTPARAMAMFNARAAQIDRAIVAESARWGDSKTATPLTRDNWLNACNIVRNGFIPGRTAVLINHLRTIGWYPSFDPPVFSQRGGTVAPGSIVTLTLAAGSPSNTTIYFTTDGSDPRLLGGFVAPGAQSIISGGSLAINSSSLIRVRAKNGTTWSALDEAAFYVTQDFSPLAITEIHYNPLPTTAGGNDGTDYEFLEFKNTGTSALDLGGLSFSSGLTYAFPASTTIAPGAYFILVKNSVKFAARYPGVPIGGVFSAVSLDNSGEGLTLVTAQGGTVLNFDFDDGPPWPAAADGSGFSVVPLGTVYNDDDGGQWRASANVHGSPGADDPSVNFPAIKVNEALTNSVLPQKDTIELINTSGAPVAIGDWWLSDDRGTPKKYRISAGTVIPANGTAVFDESQFNPTPGAGGSFALSATGDSIYVFSGDAAGNLTGYSHGWDVAASEPDVSFGRNVSSVGEQHFVRQVASSFDATNAGPLVGPLVISEIMYHPFGGFDEYIEIQNLAESVVSLDGPAGTTWRLAGINYTFPAGQSVPANGRALIVGIDPTAFRTKYGVPAQVPIFGPYGGVLQDSGERISLEKPDAPFLNNDGLLETPYIVIDVVRYNDKAPWPTIADGEGPSLQRLNATNYANDPVNWFASGATPGLANSVNQAPTVSLTAPTSGTNYTIPATVNFAAAASDPDGTLARVEFYVDGTKVGEDASAPYTLAWTATGGIHSCTALAIDNALGLTRSAPITVLVTTPVNPGLKAEYYANRFLSTPVAFTRTDATVNFSDANGWVNFGGVGVDQFSVRWTGQVRPSSTGVYTFYTNSDDGVRLSVNGLPLVDNWTDHGPTENFGTISLTAGQLYSITMEFYENTGGATAQLSWSGPGVGKQIIPQAVLYPNSTPIIIGQPTNVTVEAGGNASFTVVASGIGNSYQWRLNGVNIDGATGATIMCSPAIPSDAGVYSCFVSNSSGFTISGNATLNVSFTDGDGDGMQNSWEVANGLNPSSVLDAALDKDGDGKSNLEEFMAGTNPSDPNDYLRLTIAKVAAGWKMTFVAQTRKSYVLQCKSGLSTSTWNVLQSYPEQTGVRTVELIDVTPDPTRFYRIATPGQ